MTIIILIATALHVHLLVLGLCTSGTCIGFRHLFDTILYQYTYLKWKDYTDACLSGVSAAS